MLHGNNLDDSYPDTARREWKLGFSTLTHESLSALYQHATGSRTPRGARRWAAAELGVDERTVARWLAGDTRPSARMLVRLNIAARMGAARRERDAGRGWWHALRKFFARLNLEDAARVQVQEDLDRARRIDREFRLGGIGERDQLFGRATRDGVVYTRR